GRAGRAEALPTSFRSLPPTPPARRPRGRPPSSRSRVTPPPWTDRRGSGPGAQITGACPPAGAANQRARAGFFAVRDAGRAAGFAGFAAFDGFFGSARAPLVAPPLDTAGFAGAGFAVLRGASPLAV